MKNHIPFLLLLCVTKFVFGQVTPSVKKQNDTIKTEVINVITSYTPKVTDAFKIKSNPVIKLSDKVKKRKLNYTIISAPVASTFIPQKGTFKSFNSGDKERIYRNYIAAGFGNNTTPYIEAFLGQKVPFENEYGLYTKYTSAKDPVKNTPLNSSFLDLSANLFYKQETRYYDWKIGADFQHKKRNWYGIPNTINFAENVLDSINEKQHYNYIKTFGKIHFVDSNIDLAKLSISYFNDRWNSNEIEAAFDSRFVFPFQKNDTDFNDITINFSLEYLDGQFSKSYEQATKLEHRFFTANINPKYRFNFEDFDVKLGAKIYFSADIKHNVNQFFGYPDVEISYPVVKNYTTLYVGSGGDLHTNSYKKFTEENPFVSPTLYLTQTNEMYNFFGGLKGKLSSDISYDAHIKYKKEEDKPLFFINNSKSNGTTTEANGTSFLGYEYGNSFNVLYDDVKTFSFFGEVEYYDNKNMTLGINASVNSYTLTQQLYAWNLPQFKSELYAKYKNNKWYAGATIFYVGSRKDVTYTGVYPSTSSAVDLKGYLDANLSVEYLFNNYFSVFVNANNILDNNYQRFLNYNVQGFQILGGLTYKFDF
ncbi:hypothetical protein [Tenacibaculum sp. UWU-22]|uniref:hypothetical protein n=1 Tax=Tenacibaculum sp. UWU-22 TaxID=3234187 RepID=UPI0034DB240D